MPTFQDNFQNTRRNNDKFPAFVTNSGSPEIKVKVLAKKAYEQQVRTSS
jgi:hypothetical protein